MSQSASSDQAAALRDLMRQASPAAPAPRVRPATPPRPSPPAARPPAIPSPPPLRAPHPNPSSSSPSSLSTASPQRQPFPTPRPEALGAAAPPPLPPRAQTIAIASGKGGVGKTTLTTNLAVTLGGMGRQVVVLDADLGTANVDVLCDLSPRVTLAHVIAGRASLTDVMVEGPGFSLIPGASGLSSVASLGDADRDRLIERLQGIEQGADLVLIDCGAGVSNNVLGFALAADTVLVVTTPEPTAIADAYALIKSLVRRTEDLDIRVLVNEARTQAEAKAVYQRVSEVCRQFLRVTPGFAGAVLLDPAVPQSIRLRQPFVCAAGKGAGGPAVQCVRQIAHRLSADAVEPRRESLLRRMTHWFGRA